MWPLPASACLSFSSSALVSALIPSSKFKRRSKNCYVADNWCSSGVFAATVYVYIQSVRQSPRTKPYQDSFLFFTLLKGHSSKGCNFQLYFFIFNTTLCVILLTTTPRGPHSIFPDVFIKPSQMMWNKANTVSRGWLFKLLIHPSAVFNLASYHFPVSHEGCSP